MANRVGKHARILLAALLIATGGFATATLRAGGGDDCCGSSLGGGDCSISTKACSDGCTDPNFPICCDSGGFCTPTG